MGCWCLDRQVEERQLELELANTELDGDLPQTGHAQEEVVFAILDRITCLVTQQRTIVDSPQECMGIEKAPHPDTVNGGCCTANRSSLRHICFKAFGYLIEVVGYPDFVPSATDKSALFPGSCLRTNQPEGTTVFPSDHHFLAPCGFGKELGKAIFGLGKCHLHHGLSILPDAPVRSSQTTPARRHVGAESSLSPVGIATSAWIITPIASEPICTIDGLRSDGPEG